jgi:hypothetical protein
MLLRPLTGHYQLSLNVKPPSTFVFFFGDGKRIVALAVPLQAGDEEKSI